MTVAAYHDHPLRKTIVAFLELANNPAFADPAVAENEQHSFARDKVFAQARLLERLLEVTPASCVSFSALSNMQTHAQHALNELNAFIGDKNPGHLTSAASYFDQHVQPSLWGFAPSSIEGHAGLAAKILDDLSRTASATVHHLAAQRDALDEKLQHSETKAGELEKQLATMTGTAGKERADALAEVARLQQAFAEKEAERATSFEAALQAIRTAHQSLEGETRAAASALTQAIEGYRDQAAKIVQVVGEIGVTGKYQTTANAEAKQANTWRRITVGFFTLGIALAVLTFFHHWGQPITPESLASIAVRLLYAMAVTAPAFYTARESARHRTNADRARQTELELASLSPFIELLPTDKKIEITEHMTKVYFGRDVAPHTAKGLIDINELAALLASHKGVAKALAPNQ